MPLALTLSLGESFAEITGRSPIRRWYLPKKNLSDGLKETLADDLVAGGSINLVLKSAAFDWGTEALSAPVAFLVTAGFETWLDGDSKQSQGIGHDSIFGIGERVHADGRVSLKLELSELEFLLAKFALLKISTLAIGFLHAQRFPEHEIRAARFFEEHGFEVVTSHNARGGASHAGNHNAGDGKSQDTVSVTETDRWKLAILQARKRAFLKEQVTNIRAAFGECAQQWEIRSDGDTHPTCLRLEFELERFSLTAPTGYRSHGSDHELAGYRSHDSKSTNAHAANEHSFERHLLDLQPTQAIVLGAFGAPEFELGVTGFEPGPVLLGKSFKPTVLDLFYVQDCLEQIEGVAPQVPARARARILETFFTLGKHLKSDTTIPGTQIAAELEHLAIEKIAAACIGFSDGPPASNKTIIVAGSLAPALLPLLQTRLGSSMVLKLEEELA